VVLKCADSAFRGVAVVDMGRDQLEIDVFLDEELTERVGAFVVEAGEPGAKASGGEAEKYGLVGMKDGGSGAIGKGLNVDGVAV